MTRSETDLIIQLSKDTNAKLTELATRFNAHVEADASAFERLSVVQATHETRWKWLTRGLTATAGIMTSVGGWLGLR